MTPEEAEWRVGVIRVSQSDPEVAHSLEDDLYYEVVRMVAAIVDSEDFTYFDLSELVQIAKTALKTRKMYFSRWYA